MIKSQILPKFFINFLLSKYIAIFGLDNSIYRVFYPFYSSYHSQLHVIFAIYAFSSLGISLLRLISQISNISHNPMLFSKLHIIPLSLQLSKLFPMFHITRSLYDILKFQVLSYFAMIKPFQLKIFHFQNIIQRSFGYYVTTMNSCARTYVYYVIIIALIYVFRHDKLLCVS